MLPDRVSYPGPLTYESGALPIALRGPACSHGTLFVSVHAEWRKLLHRLSKCFTITRMVVHGQLVEPAVGLSDLYDVFLLDIVRDTDHDI